MDPNPENWRFDNDLKCKVCQKNHEMCHCWKKQMWCVKFSLLKDNVDLADCISFVPERYTRKLKRIRKIEKCIGCTGCIMCLLQINKINVVDLWKQTEFDKISKLGQFVWSKRKQRKIKTETRN
jgi:hypothetical protein